MTRERGLAGLDGARVEEGEDAGEVKRGPVDQHEETHVLRCVAVGGRERGVCAGAGRRVTECDGLVADTR